jgi:hypothetical protein
MLAVHLGLAFRSRVSLAFGDRVFRRLLASQTTRTRAAKRPIPQVSGVPEATLERFGLTRPFPGAAEADHIQLLGSAY